MNSQGLLVVDGARHGLYRDLDLPTNWRQLRFSGRHGLSHALRLLVAEYPDASSYGWLADDNLPRTPHFDRLLEEAAGDWCLAYANDGGWVSGTIEGKLALQAGGCFSAGLCWGGELVRTVGWLAFPGSFQAGTDVAWAELVRPYGLHRYLDEVVVEHRHWRSGKRPQDRLDTDMEDTNGQRHTSGDVQRLYEWIGSAEMDETLERIKQNVDARVARLSYLGPGVRA